jgi:hypothetical protein
MIAKVFLIGLVAAVVMRLSSASAGYFDGNKLNWWCSNPDGSPPQAECYGYVAGVADANGAQESLSARMYRVGQRCVLR